MRQKAFACAGFALLLGILAFPVLAQSRSINYETYIVDSFDGSEDTDWSWTAAGSKFITDGYPVVKYFDGMPNAMRVMQTDEDGNYQVLGIQFKFNRQGDNWVDIIPMAAAEGGEGDEEGGDGESPYEIPFRGVVSRIDMWVWGAGYYYQLEVLLRDCYGRVHALPMGTLNYEGWRNLSVNVPTNLPQTSRYLGDEHNMRFVAFRIRTSPTERVDDFGDLAQIADFAVAGERKSSNLRVLLKAVCVLCPEDTVFVLAEPFGEFEDVARKAAPCEFTAGLGENVPGVRIALEKLVSSVEAPLRGKMVSLAFVSGESHGA